MLAEFVNGAYLDDGETNMAAKYQCQVLLIEPGLKNENIAALLLES